jgi:plastocyanin
MRVATRRIFGAHGAHNLRRVLAAALIAALALVALAGARSVGDAHAATTCTKHTKRVVKHVKRHGKRKRVVQLKHFWTCQEVADPSPPATTTTPAPAPTPAPETPAPQPEPVANAIGVVARDANKEFRFEPSRTVVKSGQLTMQLINEGEDPHSMAIQRLGPGEVGEGPVKEIPKTPSNGHGETSVVVEPGRYRIYCTLFNHAEEGMKFDLTVE